MKLNDQLQCYLTEDAQQAIAELCDAGLDQDLALSVLEKLWPEAAIYELPEEEEDSTPAPRLRVL